MKRIVSQKLLLLLLLITLLGAFFRFYNLSWGAPFYFHPDERNIIYSITQLKFLTNLHPGFFAYGSFPIYTIFFTGLYKQLLFGVMTNAIRFDDAVIISRFFSALFSTALIPLLFVLGKKLNGLKTGIITAFLATLNIGFIQFAHFGTFEMWLTFGSTLLFLLCLSYLEKQTLIKIISLGIFLGLLISVKISSLILFPLIVITLLLPYQSLSQFMKQKKVVGMRFFLIFLVACSVFLITNPYVFIDSQAFENSMNYESSLALGATKVFYTGEFINTVPIVYPFLRVYPFLLNPIILISFLFAFFFFCRSIFKTKNKRYLLLGLFFVVLFFSQALLFVKWTRYYVPTIPFILLIVATGLTTHFSKRHFGKGLVLFLILVSGIFACSYFITAFVEKDTRLQTLDVAEKIIPKNASILSEVYDLGIMPFNEHFPNITLYNVYDIDATKIITNPQVIVKDSEYILIPSQRIVKPRLLNQKEYPNGYAYYQQLFSGSLGYELIYKTPCSIFCQITYLTDPVYTYEGTASVFDRPTLYLFKKR